MKVVQVKSAATSVPKRRTSLDLPPDLLERTDEAVKLGIASSRNNLIAAAVEEYLKGVDRRASIDARFASMTADAAARRLHLSLAAAFARSDAEVLPEVEEGGP